MAKKRKTAHKKFTYEKGIIIDQKGRQYDLAQEGDSWAFNAKYTLDLKKVIAHHEKIRHNQRMLFDRDLKVNYPHLHKIIESVKYFV